MSDRNLGQNPGNFFVGELFTKEGGRRSAAQLAPLVGFLGQLAKLTLIAFVGGPGDPVGNRTHGFMEARHPAKEGRKKALCPKV